MSVVVDLDESSKGSNKPKESKKSKIDYEMVGTRHHPLAVRKEFVWILPKPTLRDFFEYARTQLSVKQDEEIRAWRKDPQTDIDYLIGFPHRFQLKKHRVMLEKGRYNKFAEFLINVCKLNEDGTRSQYIPVIIEKTKSVKALKELALNALGENGRDCKKWMAYDVSLGEEKRDKPWSESWSLNMPSCSPFAGARVALMIGKDRVSKQIELCCDQRNLETPWKEVQGLFPLKVTRLSGTD